MLSRKRSDHLFQRRPAWTWFPKVPSRLDPVRARGRLFCWPHRNSAALGSFERDFAAANCLSDSNSRLFQVRGRFCPFTLAALDRAEREVNFGFVRQSSLGDFDFFLRRLVIVVSIIVC